MGVREFDSAKTAEETRLQRGTRRRYNRRIRRIQLLQQTIEPLFKGIPGFFIQHQEKHFWRNSNDFENNSLSETLKDLNQNPKSYPTIYHLRDTLIKRKEKTHPRLIYLALHHLTKYRGHFLNENMTWTSNKVEKPLSIQLKDLFTELVSFGYPKVNLERKAWERLSDLLKEKEYTKRDKEREIKKILGKGNQLAQPIKLIIGATSDVTKLFSESDHVDLYQEERLKLSFETEDITEVYEKLSEEEKQLIDRAQLIFQNVLLTDLLGTAAYVSEAKVKAYDQFGKDLVQLKQIFNKHFGEKAYREMFISSPESLTEDNERNIKDNLCLFDRFIKDKSKYEEKFYNDLKKQLDKLSKEKSLLEKEKNEIQQVIKKLETNQYLVKQRGKMNAAIPNQNNVYEAEQILRNQQAFYPEITDEMITRVKQIIEFRIPYYIGPLIKDREDARFGWMVRKKDGRVKPWTIDEIIDSSASAEGFINRMTSYCAYLPDQKVLPKCSLRYQLFEVLNELNGIQIRKSNELPNKKYRLPKEVKEWIIDNVFKRYKNVTHTILKRELKKGPYKEYVFDENTEGLKDIYGTQKDNRFVSSLSTWIEMQNIFGEINSINLKMIEKVIYYISVFEEKDILKLKIKEKYPRLTDNQVNTLCNLNYTGWGRLSKLLIDELPADRDNNTILDVMKQKPLVFMEVLSQEKYNLKERISKMSQDNQAKYTRIRYQDIKELQGSPAIKRGIWQAILIIEELVEIFGEPEHIMIEFAREDRPNLRTTKRKKAIQDLEKAISKDEKELKSFLKDQLKSDESDFKDLSYYLYVTQGGRCLYSGEEILLHRLQDYEIDHIYPRSFVKDDSIDNLALVTQGMNQEKGYDKMPLEILSTKQKAKQRHEWKKLFDLKLISQKKYYRLLKDKFSDQDKESFFARQLVETRQITRHVRDLLEERFEQTEIHPVNANIVTNLRSHSDTYKIRELNNKHHAVDAALAALVVQFIINRYGTNFLNFNFKYQEARKKWREQILDYGKHFFLFKDIDEYDKFHHFQTGEVLSGREFLKMINYEMPWQTTKRLGTDEGAFYNETIYSPKEQNPQYKSSKLNIGVHSNLNRDSAYLISYEYYDKKKRLKSKSEIVDLFVIEKMQIKNYSQKELANFLANKVAPGEVTDAIIHTKILKYQPIVDRGLPLYFVTNNEKHMRKQFMLGQEIIEKIMQCENEQGVSVEFLKDTYQLVAESAIEQYKDYLSPKNIENIENYVSEVSDYKSFAKGIEDLFRMTSANAARTKKFGGRYTKAIDVAKTTFIHQSITGLRYRKPKSYRKELWSK